MFLRVFGCPVRFGNVLELLGGVRLFGYPRMIFVRQLTVSVFNLLGGGGTRYTQSLVVVLVMHGFREVARVG